MKRIVLIFVYLITINSFSQDKKFNVELSYPIAIGDNFFAEGNYKGYVDLGFGYNFLKKGNFNLGIEIRGSYYKRKHTGTLLTPMSFESPIINTIFTEPKIRVSYTIPSLEKLKFSTGLGYSFVWYNVNTGDVNIENYTIEDNGFSINFSASYFLTDYIYALINYGFTKTQGSLLPEINKTSFNTNISTLKFGLGYSFKKYIWIIQNLF